MDVEEKTDNQRFFKILEVGHLLKTNFCLKAWSLFLDNYDYYNNSSSVLNGYLSHILADSLKQPDTWALFSLSVILQDHFSSGCSAFLTSLH